MRAEEPLRALLRANGEGEEVLEDVREERSSARTSERGSERGGSTDEEGELSGGIRKAYKET